MNKFRLKCQGGRWWVQEKFFGFLWLTIWNSSLTKESAMAKIAEHVQEKEDECIYYPTQEEIIAAVSAKMLRPGPPPAPPSKP